MSFIIDVPRCYVIRLYHWNLSCFANCTWVKFPCTIFENMEWNLQLRGSIWLPACTVDCCSILTPFRQECFYFLSIHVIWAQLCPTVDILLTFFLLWGLVSTSTHDYIIDFWVVLPHENPYFVCAYNVSELLNTSKCGCPIVLIMYINLWEHFRKKKILGHLKKRG